MVMLSNCEALVNSSACNGVRNSDTCCRPSLARRAGFQAIVGCLGYPKSSADRRQGDPTSSHQGRAMTDLKKMVANHCTSQGRKLPDVSGWKH